MCKFLRSVAIESRGAFTVRQMNTDKPFFLMKLIQISCNHRNPSDEFEQELTEAITSHVNRQAIMCRVTRFSFCVFIYSFVSLLISFCRLSFNLSAVWEDLSWWLMN